MEKNVTIALTVNGESIVQSVSPRTSLADFLRTTVGATGTHIGCEQGSCGACSVRVDGQVVRSCLMFAVQADDAEVQTVEGAGGDVEVLQQAFHERNALQCGFCTPGMLMTASELLKVNPTPSRSEIREYLSGNYCRCTGYEAIVDAVYSAARSRS